MSKYDKFADFNRFNFTISIFTPPHAKTISWDPKCYQDIVSEPHEQALGGTNEHANVTQISRFDNKSLFGQRSRRGWSPVEHRGTFVRPAVHLSVPPWSGLSGLKSGLSGLSGLKSGLSGLQSGLSGPQSGLSGLSGLKPGLSGLKPGLSGLKPGLSGFKTGHSILEISPPSPCKPQISPPRPWISRLSLKIALSDFESVLKGLSGRTKESPPVFYRTSFPSGGPCFPSLKFSIMQSRAMGNADHILPLGDWLYIGEQTTGMNEHTWH